jgi:very-short-patch-repair endonuclease
MQLPDEKTSHENQQWLGVYRALILKWAELHVKELDDDGAKIPTVDIFEQLCFRAKWEKYSDAMLATSSVMKRYESERGKLELFAWMFGDRIGMDGASLPIDIEQRLTWYKDRISGRFERGIRETFGAFGVGSPIEQLFVMEWHYQQVSERLGAKLRPQAHVETDRGAVRIDFVVEPLVADALPLAIELDGHEFHEKTKGQAAHDRKRERSIVRSGYQVIRFTGHEVFQDAGACVKEVVQLLSKPKPDVVATAQAS